MPHPENFNYLDELIESVHEYAQDSLKGCGPLTKEDAALEDQKDGAGMPIQHPLIICSFPSTGVVTREALDYLGSDSKAVTEIFPSRNIQREVQKMDLKLFAGRLIIIFQEFDL